MMRSVNMCQGFLFSLHGGIEGLLGQSCWLVLRKVAVLMIECVCHEVHLQPQEELVS
jgi:hypothetical protein